MMCCTPRVRPPQSAYPFLCSFNFEPFLCIEFHAGLADFELADRLELTGQVCKGTAFLCVRNHMCINCTVVSQARPHESINTHLRSSPTGPPGGIRRDGRTGVPAVESMVIVAGESAGQDGRDGWEKEVSVQGILHV